MKMVKKLLFLLACSQAAAAVPLVSISSNNTALSGSDATVGWTFSISRTLWVDSIGFFDQGQDGLNESHQVGLWNSSGTLLASAVINNSNVLVDGFRYSALGSLLTLGPGTYTLAAFVRANSPDRVAVSAVYTALPGVTYLDDRIIFSPTFQQPTGPNSFAHPSYFSANLNVVPELDALSSTAPLAFAGLLLLIGRTRRFRVGEAHARVSQASVLQHLQGHQHLIAIGLRQQVQIRRPSQLAQPLHRRPAHSPIGIQ